jgi:hypothetical protein
MKYVGQAASDNMYDKSRIKLFGIANWTTVINNDALQKVTIIIYEKSF